MAWCLCTNLYTPISSDAGRLTYHDDTVCNVAGRHEQTSGRHSRYAVRETRRTDTSQHREQDTRSHASRKQFDRAQGQIDVDTQRRSPAPRIIDAQDHTPIEPLDTRPFRTSAHATWQEFRDDRRRDRSAESDRHGSRCCCSFVL